MSEVRVRIEVEGPVGEAARQELALLAAAVGAAVARRVSQEQEDTE